MLNKFDSKYKIPGRQTITKKFLKEKFEKVKKSINVRLMKQTICLSHLMACRPLQITHIWVMILNENPSFEIKIKQFVFISIKA